MKELHSLVKGSRSFMMTLYSSSTLLGLAIVAQAYLIAGIVDRVFLKDASLTDVWPLLVALLVAFAFRAIFSWLNGRTGIRFASSVKGEVRKKLLNKWAHQPLTASVGSQAGERSPSSWMQWTGLMATTASMYRSGSKQRSSH
ncbi:hypothetical protein ACPJHQ_08960 [Rossellomorea sp. H39__3]